jgi:hypothetical protein
MERRRRQEDGAEFDGVRRGWCLGSEEFRQELLAAAADRVGAGHYGADRRESGEEKAGRIVREELRCGGWKQGDLAGKRKGDKFKVRLARRLRRQTTMKPEMDREATAHGKLDLCLQPPACKTKPLNLCQ